MVNRTGTYIAFDGLGEQDPTKSDFRYYATIQGWDASNRSEFRFTNSHEKASAVRDTSKLATLQASIRLRLQASKNMLIVLSDDTRKSGSVLSWEIEQAIDNYGLPLIIAHTGYNSILNPQGLASRWPTSLAARLSNWSANAIHVPFKQAAIFDAIHRFTVNGEKLNGAFAFYNEAAHRQWGYIS